MQTRPLKSSDCAIACCPLRAFRRRSRFANERGLSGANLASRTNERWSKSGPVVHAALLQPGRPARRSSCRQPYMSCLLARVTVGHRGSRDSAFCAGCQVTRGKGALEPLSRGRQEDSAARRVLHDTACEGHKQQHCLMQLQLGLDPGARHAPHTHHDAAVAVRHHHQVGRVPVRSSGNWTASTRAAHGCCTALLPS